MLLSKTSTAVRSKAFHCASIHTPIKGFLIIFFSSHRASCAEACPAGGRGGSNPPISRYTTFFALPFPSFWLLSSSSLSFTEQEELSLPRRAVGACHRGAGMPHTELPRVGRPPWGNLALIGNFMIFQHGR